MDKMEVEIDGIVWCTDGEDVDLPVRVSIEVDPDDDDDDIIDRLSDEYGWLVESVGSIKRKEASKWKKKAKKAKRPRRRR